MVLFKKYPNKKMKKDNLAQKKFWNSGGGIYYPLFWEMIK